MSRHEAHLLHEQAPGPRIRMPQIRGNGAAPVEVARRGVRAAAVALTRARQGRGHGAAQTLEDVGDNAGDECPQPIGQSG